MSIKISVVMSVYNGEIFLRESIESILNQTYKDIEFIIINDGSDDNSLEIIQSYMDVDSRIVLLNHKNIGLTKSLNIGIKKATGAYIARQDADDISSPGRFVEFVKFLKRRKFVDVYSTPAVLIDERGNDIKIIPRYVQRHGFNTKMLNCRNILIHGALIIKSTLIKEYKYNNKYVYSQDFELYHRLIQDGFDISYDASNISYKLRAHRGQISVKSSDSQSVFFNRVIEKYKKCTVSNGMYLLLLDISFFFLELFKKRK